MNSLNPMSKNALTHRIRNVVRRLLSRSVSRSFSLLMVAVILGTLLPPASFGTGLAADPPDPQEVRESPFLPLIFKAWTPASSSSSSTGNREGNLTIAWGGIPDGDSLSEGKISPRPIDEIGDGPEMLSEGVASLPMVERILSKNV